MKVTFNQEVGDLMGTALHEVEKFHRVRHDGWPKGQEVEIAFENKYSGKDGPSAAVACALMIESLISGVELDQSFAVTGDMNADGSVQPVGGISAKIRGASAKECDVVAVPDDNKTLVADAYIMEGPEAVNKIQIFSIKTFEEALALGRKDRDEKLTGAIEKFAKVQKVVNDKGVGTLKHPQVQAVLKEVVQAAPNHLSAKLLLLHGIGRGPDKLSLAGSLVSIEKSAYSVLRGIKNSEFETSALDGDKIGDAVYKIRALRTKLDPRTKSLADSIEEFASNVREFNQDRSTGASAKIEIIKRIRSSGQRVDTEYDKLRQNREVMEELMAE
ncbi:MAG: S16 family serine protease [Verrucomicrobiales bacterium]